MTKAAPYASETVRARLRSLGAILAALFTAGCATAPGSTFVDWAPGSYEFQVTHPEAGPVRGTITVQEEGPVGVVTDTFGACLATDPLVPGYRDRDFRCGRDYSVHVRRGQDGEDPVVGQVSNQRTEVQTRQVRSTCAYRQASPEGRDVCVQWTYRTVEEHVTTGTAERFRVVQASRD